MPTAPGYIPGSLVIPFVTAVRLRWRYASNKEGSNILHANNEASIAVDVATANAINDGLLADARTTAFIDALSTNVTYFGLGLRDLTEPNRAEYLSDSGGFTGGNVTDALPSGVAMCVTLKSAVSGPRGRGRVYLGGFTEDATDAGGRIQTGTSALALGFVQALSDALFSVGMPLTIANRAHAEYVSAFTGLTVAAEPAGDNPVTSITTTDLVFDSQRRRKG